MQKFNIPIFTTTTEYKSIEADSLEKAIKEVEIGLERIVDYKTLTHDLIRQRKVYQDIEKRRKTKTVRTIIQAGLTSQEYDDEIEYDGSRQGLEKEIAELRAFYTQCIVVNSFGYKWEEID